MRKKTKNPIRCPNCTKWVDTLVLASVPRQGLVTSLCPSCVIKANNVRKQKGLSRNGPVSCIRIEHSNTVEVWAGSLHIVFLFPNQIAAKTFALAAAESGSVNGVSLFRNGKFVGGRDGAGS